MTDQPTRPLGRRQYDPAGSDHDLLVRIDERLAGMAGMLAAAVARIASLEAWRANLETWRAEQDGEKRANARQIAAIVACSSGLTALAVKVAEKFGG